MNKAAPKKAVNEALKNVELIYSKTNKIPFYKTPKDLQNRINSYFQLCFDNNAHVTLTSMGYYLGLFLEEMNRLENEEYQEDSKKYENTDTAGFSFTIKRAKYFIHNYCEQLLLTHLNPTGVIFSLKNNFGWTDRIDIYRESLTVNVEISGEELERIQGNASKLLVDDVMQSIDVSGKEVKKIDNKKGK